MAQAGKFCPSVVAVSVILLSVWAAGERQCSWCGPLAEQVHRSQRAPPCDQPGETTCDNGLSHCAIVASSPPYVESRLCVKYYQDECYSIFCNSSRTWRMTCPCRGDFCNKEKTEREHEAFAFIARLGSKIQNLRIRKRTVTPVKFISQVPNKTAIVNEENETMHNSTTQYDKKNEQTDQDNMTLSGESDKIITETIMNDLNDNNSVDKSKDNVPKTNEVNVNNVGNNSEILSNNTSSTVVMNNNDVNTVANTNRLNNDEITTSASNPMTMANNMLAITDNPERTTEAISGIKPSELPSMDEPQKDINIDVANNIDHAADSFTEKSIDDKISIKMDIKPSVALPAAEALQQNSSPSVMNGAVTEKTQPTTEHVTTETTSMITTAHVPMTVPLDPMQTKKNHAVRTSLHFIPPLFWTMLYF